MSNPLCKYCGKPMDVARIEYADTWYECKCDGYLREQDLQAEISKMEYSLAKKRDELQQHQSNSLYEKSIRELKEKIRKIEELHRVLRG